jgi:Lipocalin-like domain
MRKKTFVFSLLITTFTICLIIESCKKDDRSSNPIVGKWKMTAYIHNGIDVYGTQVYPCVIDNIVTFTSDQQVMVDEGPTKCNSSDPQTITGTFSFNSDNTQLTVSSNGSSDVDYVRTLNSTTLKVEQISNGDVITYTKIP